MRVGCGGKSHSEKGGDGVGWQATGGRWLIEDRFTEWKWFGGITRSRRERLQKASERGG
jgi:hypothetical protein